MTEGVVSALPKRRRTQLQNWSCIASVVLWVFFLLPQMGHLASRYEFIQSLQFCAFAFVVPVLLVVGAPWRVFGSKPSPQHVSNGRRAVAFFFDIFVEKTEGRAGVGGRNRALALAAIYVAMDIFWRTASMVDLLARRPVLDGAEAVSFLIIGAAVFSELVESPPTRPKVGRVQRFVTAAVVMWTTWIMAYLQGMSGHSWYGVFRNVVGRRLSMANDQQLATFSIWLIAAAVFLPIIFGNIIHWLQDQSRLDAENIVLG